MSKKFELGKSYFREDIDDLAVDLGGIDVEDYGPDIIGRNILVVIGINDDIATFVLDGAMAGKFTYKLVYIH